MNNMKKNMNKPEGKIDSAKVQEQDPKAKRKVSKTLEAARRLKGRLIVNDPQFLL